MSINTRTIIFWNTVASFETIHSFVIMLSICLYGKMFCYNNNVGKTLVIALQFAKLSSFKYDYTKIIFKNIIITLNV